MRKFLYSCIVLFLVFGGVLRADITLKAHGGVLQFDNNSSVASVGYNSFSSLDSTQKFTIESWVNMKQPTNRNTLFNKYVSDDNRVQLTVTNAGLFELIVSNGGNAYGYTANGVAQWNTWSHIAMVYDGTQSTNATKLKLYINGVEIALSYTTTIPPTTANLSAAITKKVGSMVGLMDEFRLWDTARTQVDINTSKNQQLDGNESGLVAYYNFDERVGTTIKDRTINGYNGTITGNVQRVNFLGDSLDFNGSTAVDIGSSDTYGIGDGITIGAWINSQDLSNGSIFGNSHFDTVAKGYVLRTETNGSVSFVYGDSNTSDWRYMTSPAGLISANKWYYLTVVQTPTSQKIYIDGVEVVSNTGTYDLNQSTTNTFIGLDYGNRYFVGKIAEVSVWNRDLNQTQIQKNMYSSPYDNMATDMGLIGYWPLNDGNGTIAKNYINSDNNGTIANGTWTSTAPTIYGDTIYTYYGINSWQKLVAQNISTPNFTTTTNDFIPALNASSGLFIYNSQETNIPIEMSETTSDQNISITIQSTMPSDITTGLIAHYKFEGNANDSSGNDYNGTYSSFGNGKFGQSASFNGAQSLAVSGSITSVLPSGSEARTVSMWIKPNVSNSTEDFVSWGSNDLPNERFSVMKFATTGQDVNNAFGVAAGVANSDFIGNYSINTSSWQHLTAVYEADATNIKFYVNGVLVNTLTDPRAILETASANPLYIGSNPAGGGEFFNGSLDEVRIYNRALSNSDVASLYAFSPILQDSNGTSGDDLIAAPEYNMAIDGGNGIDTIILSGTKVSYTVVKNSDGSFTITNGTRTYIVSNIEKISFSDVENFNINLDLHFGTNGVVTFSTDGYDFGNGVVLQSDGKIVVVGATPNGSYSDFLVMRYDSNGSLDSTFGNAGKVQIDSGANNNDYANGVAIQSDGKIVVTGHTEGGTSSKIMTVRLNTNGSLDTTFGTNGIALNDISASYSDEGRGVVIQSDGKIIIGGVTATTSTNTNYIVLRLTSSGILDATFNSNGYNTMDVYNNGDILRDLVLQSDGKIVFTGESFNGTNYDMVTARLNSDGSFDSTFGSSGRVVTTFGSSGDAGKSVALQSDGKILVAGYGNSGTKQDVALVRLTSTGAYDTTFDTDGKLTLSLNAYDSTALSMKLLNNGKIMLAGSSNSGTNNDVMFAKLDSNGSFDTTFGDGGKVILSMNSTNTDLIQSIAIQSDSKVVGVGFSDVGSNYDLKVVRLNAYDPIIYGSTSSTTGTTGDDLIVPNSDTNQSIDGLAGVDKVILPNAKATYTVTKPSSVYIVTDGIKTYNLSNIEYLSFSDVQNVNLAFIIPYVSQLSSGLLHSVVIKNDGTLWAWGNNAQGAYGDGTNTNVQKPKQIGTASNWLAVTAGEGFTLALKTDGTLWSAGDNTYGQLGRTGTANILTQVGSDKWVRVYAGRYHALGIKSDGTLWAWGHNGTGTIGDGTTTNRTIPTQVGTSNDWIDIAGGRHSIGLKRDGTIWGWGSNSHGQIGQPNTTTSILTPTQIGTATNWTAVYAGQDTSFAVNAIGETYGFGYDGNGQMGDGGTNTSTHIPSLISNPSTSWKNIRGGEYQIGGVKSDGTLWGWGHNGTSGQLGDGTTVDKNIPTQIGTSTNWIDVDGSQNYSIGIKSDGSVWGWGSNSVYQLGDGTTSNSLTPKFIGFLLSPPISGTTGNDNLIGTSNNDYFAATTGQDYINGGDGDDMVLYSGTKSQYTVTKSGSTYTVTKPDGVDTLTNIEFLSFSDIQNVLITSFVNSYSLFTYDWVDNFKQGISVSNGVLNFSLGSGVSSAILEKTTTNSFKEVRAKIKPVSLDGTASFSMIVDETIKIQVFGNEVKMVTINPTGGIATSTSIFDADTTTSFQNKISYLNMWLGNGKVYSNITDENQTQIGRIVELTTNATTLSNLKFEAQIGNQSLANIELQDVLFTSTPSLVQLKRLDFLTQSSNVATYISATSLDRSNIPMFYLTTTTDQETQYIHMGINQNLLKNSQLYSVSLNLNSKNKIVTEQKLKETGIVTNNLLTIGTKEQKYIGEMTSYDVSTLFSQNNINFEFSSDAKGYRIYEKNGETVTLKYALNQIAVSDVLANFGLNKNSIKSKSITTLWTYLALPTNINLCIASYQTSLPTLCNQDYTVESIFGSIDTVYKHTGYWSYFDSNTAKNYNFDKLGSLSSKEGLLVKSEYARTLNIPYDISKEISVELMDMSQKGWSLVHIPFDMTLSELSAKITAGGKTLKHIFRFKNNLWDIYAPQSDNNFAFSIPRITTLQSDDIVWIEVE